MKLYSILLGIWLLCGSNLLAQNSKYTKIKAESNFVEKIPNNQKYQYVAFKPGTVAYNTGNAAVGKFNYNFLLDEVHFIDPQGDTLSLANEYIIKHVIIEQDTFYYDAKNGYLQIIDYYKPINLAIKQSIRIIRSEKQAAYDQSSAVSSIKQYSYYINQSGQLRKLEPKGNLLLAKENSFYIIDQNHRVLLANKANVLTVFQQFKSEVTAYLKTNKVDFRQETELRKLLQFCRELAS